MLLCLLVRLIQFLTHKSFKVSQLYMLEYSLVDSRAQMKSQ